jgi:hypothetical protein
MEGAKMFKNQMRKIFKSKRPNFRKVELETTEEFLARGGKIEKIPLPSILDVWGKRVKRELIDKEKER